MPTIYSRPWPTYGSFWLVVRCLLSMLCRWFCGSRRFFVCCVCFVCSCLVFRLVCALCRSVDRLVGRCVCVVPPTILFARWFVCLFVCVFRSVLSPLFGCCFVGVFLPCLFKCCFFSRVFVRGCFAWSVGVNRQRLEEAYTRDTVKASPIVGSLGLYFVRMTKNAGPTLRPYSSPASPSLAEGGAVCTQCFNGSLSRVSSALRVVPPSLVFLRPRVWFQELYGSWDQPTETVVLRKEDPNTLQLLALKFADRVTRPCLSSACGSLVVVAIVVLPFLFFFLVRYLSAPPPKCLLVHLVCII